MTMRHFLLLAGALAMIPGALQAQSIDPKVAARIDRILKATPLIDGHNDLPEQLRENYNMSVEGLASGTDRRPGHPLMTDMARLHQGHVGGQFWSVYIPSEVTGDAAIRATLEQIDIVKRLVKAYPADLELARTADDIVRIHKAGKIASLIGVEGGHQIGGSLAALRQFYDLGARYMTLSHFKNNEFADSATDDPKYHGLNDFGRTVVHEMNRLGMLVDLSHVSPETMADALDVSKAPVIFSHSDARALSDHPRNVPDDILRRLQSNGGIVMVNFYLGHLSEPYRQWEGQQSAEEALLADLYTGQPDIRKAKLAEWQQAHPAPKPDVSIIADHIEHIVKIAGHDHVGLGGDLDGIPLDGAPPGMNSVAGYPFVFAELIRRGWSDEDLAKLAGGNLLRVLRRAEAVAASMKDEPPAMARLQPLSPTDPWK
ncbi:MAG TPA: dipeptidase [Sphingomicrobium sp.]|nr:dipeptidase [Sphingomicrobium sp.]